MIVREGCWEACEHGGYRGRVPGLWPGPLSPTSAAMTNRISSLRPVAAPATAPSTDGWGSGARAMLYEGQHLTGRSMVIDNEVVANLAGTGFNDRACVVAHRGRLLDVLQRRQFHRRMP